MTGPCISIRFRVAPLSGSGAGVDFSAAEWAELVPASMARTTPSLHRGQHIDQPAAPGAPRPKSSQMQARNRARETKESRP